MHVKPFKAVYPQTDKIEDIFSFTETVRDNFSEMIRDNLLKYTDSEDFILYLIKSPLINATGIICLTDIEDYKDGLILKHEKTLEEKELDQANLMTSRQSMVKPVLLTYPAHEPFEEYLDTLKVEENLIQHFYFDDKDENHFFWRISNIEDKKKVDSFFKDDLKRVYIADGHHRLATFFRLNEEQPDNNFRYILSVFIPFKGLNIHPFHRIISLSEKMKESQILDSISELCFWERLDEFFPPKFKYNFIMHTGKSLYACVWKPSLLEKYKFEPLILDSSLLNAVLFRQIFDVKDARTDERIKYVEGYKGWEGFEKALHKGKHNIGFYLYPVAFDDFQKVSDLHLTLPPKSTWFEPRIRNGLVIHDFS